MLSCENRLLSFYILVLSCSDTQVCHFKFLPNQRKQRRAFHQRNDHTPNTWATSKKVSVTYFGAQPQVVDARSTKPSHSPEFRGATEADLGSSRTTMGQGLGRGRSAEVSQLLGSGPEFCCLSCQLLGEAHVESIPLDQACCHQLHPATSTAAVLFHRTQLLASQCEREPELCVEQAGKACSSSCQLWKQFFQSLWRSLLYSSVPSQYYHCSSKPRSCLLLQDKECMGHFYCCMQCDVLQSPCLPVWCFHSLCRPLPVVLPPPPTHPKYPYCTCAHRVVSPASASAVSLPLVCTGAEPKEYFLLSHPSSQ